MCSALRYCDMAWVECENTAPRAEKKQRRPEMIVLPAAEPCSAMRLSVVRVMVLATMCAP